MRNDSLLKLALALHESPGVYALLIGSGISRAAGIPTGWDIVLDLVRKVAAVEGEDPNPNPVAWYQAKYGEAPNYTTLLGRLTSTPAERMNLLRSYFEPTDEEREQGLKIPTPAHRAIAQLVKNGQVRMILTTNFDRLMEAALDSEAVQPDVIATDDALRGALPHIHSRCVVVKLHGDYRDTRIRNTPAELERYSRAMNQFLDRALDEFGLMVCGWSGEWDTALRDDSWNTWSALSTEINSARRPWITALASSVRSPLVIQNVVKRRLLERSSGWRSWNLSES